MSAMAWFSHVFGDFGVDVEFDTAFLTHTSRCHCGCDFATEDASDAFADRGLDLVSSDHAAETIAETFDLEAFGDAADEFDGVDGGADFREEGADKAWFVHAIFEKVVPKSGVGLIFAEGDGLGDVA